MATKKISETSNLSNGVSIFQSIELVDDKEMDTELNIMANFHVSNRVDFIKRLDELILEYRI